MTDFDNTQVEAIGDDVSVLAGVADNLINNLSLQADSSIYDEILEAIDTIIDFITGRNLTDLTDFFSPEINFGQQDASSNGDNLRLTNGNDFAALTSPRLDNLSLADLVQI